MMSKLPVLVRSPRSAPFAFLFVAALFFNLLTPTRVLAGDSPCGGIGERACACFGDGRNCFFGEPACPGNGREVFVPPCGASGSSAPDCGDLVRFLGVDEKPTV